MSESRNWIALEEIAEDQPFGTPRQRILASVRRTGRVRHVLVRRRADGKYVVVAGPQWVAAARIEKLQTIDVIFEEELEAAEPLERRRIANSLQCEALDQLFIGRCLARVLAEGGVTQADLAEEFGMSPEHICNLLRVVECPDLVAMMEDEELAFGAAKVLAGLTEQEREPVLSELRHHKAVHERFPSVVEITKLVAELLGEETIPVLTRELLLPFVADLMSQGRQIAVEVATARRSTPSVRVTVPKAERAAIAALIDRLRSGTGDAVP
jgi:ParB/RepB/Spo0J family partition protein